MLGVSSPVPASPHTLPRRPFAGVTGGCGDCHQNLAPATEAERLCYERNGEEATNIGVV